MKLLGSLAERLATWPGGDSVRRTVCWGTVSQAKQLGEMGDSTRKWAHAWIRHHMQRRNLARTEVADAGSGLSNPLLDWYRPQVKRAYLIEFLAEPSVNGNTTILRADLEKGIPLPDESADLVTSASSIEHLSQAGQLLFMTEAERVLRRGGIMVMTVSYIFKLTPEALRLLSSDPALVGTGCTISTRLNLQKMLAAAPRLACPSPPDWRMFPGFEGFSEDSVSGDPDIILDKIGSYGDVRCLPETDALRLRWAEIGLYLVKK